MISIRKATWNEWADPRERRGLGGDRGWLAWWRRGARAAAVLALAGVLSPAGSPGAESRFDNFITRRGNRLYDGEKEFRFMGANMPGLVLPYDWTLYLPERLHLPTAWEQEDAFKTLDQMNLRVVRTWNLPVRAPDEERKAWHYVYGPGEFNEEAFKTIDRLFALANTYGVRVILDLCAEYGDYLGGIGTYAAHRGKKRAEFYTDPQLKEDYKATVRHVLSRTNTVTGVAYRDEKAVLAWQFGNEMHGAPDAWLAEMAAYIKELAPRQLVAETRHRPGQPLLVDPNIDLLTRHLYSNYGGVGDGWVEAMRKEVEALKGQRPLFVGEFGPYIDGKMFTHQNVVGELRKFLDYVCSEPAIPGAMIWSMYFHHQEGGFYWHQIMTYPAVWSYHWPGFPSADAQREIGVMAAMRDAAFKIEGCAVTPMPTPDVPEMLPAKDVPLLSWRGAAGASGYDLERAPQAAGAWVAIATNISDADIAYRPLFCDATARAGDVWFYRAIARNASGASRPSNVVGPLKVERACLVDELQDFARVSGKSDGLKLNNDYNAMYAEYLFRAQGGTNDWLSYSVPGEIDTVNVVCFFAKEVSDFTFLASGDGGTFGPVRPERVERPLPAPPGGAAKGQRRTMVQYACRVPSGKRFLKVVWNGPAELDRVEIRHR